MPDRIAARSPAWVSAGPLVNRSAAPISVAMIIASVVLPSPGGPESSTWSGARPRIRAASRTSPSWSRTRTWPTTSSSDRGRSAASTARSSPSASAAVNDRDRRWLASAASSSSSWNGTASGLAQRAERGPQQARHVGCVTGQGRHRVDRLLGVAGGPAEPDQPLVDLVAPGSGAGGGYRRRAGGRGGADAVLELEDDPLRALLADA